MILAPISISINQVFAPLFYSEKRYNLSYGGRGSGKSKFMSQLFTVKLRKMDFFRGYIMREVLGDIRESQFRELKDQFEEMGIVDEFKINETTMTIQHKVTGNMVIAKGLKKSAGNQTAKVKSIKDPTDVWIEEADEIGYDDFVKIDTSIRTKKADKVQIWLTFNPENESSWINKMFFRNNEPRTDRNDCVIVHSTFECNRENLQDSYIETLETMILESPEWAKVFVKGLWGGGLKGRVFKDWKKVDEMPDEDYETFIGLDWGYNDPCAAVLIMKHSSKIFCKQLIYERRLSNFKIAEKLKNAIESLKLSENIEIFCDSAEPKSITALQDEGLNAQPALKGKGSIEAGIKLLKMHQVYVTSRSNNIWFENKNYVWKQNDAKKDDENPDGFTDEPVDKYNHSMDAIRYGVFTKYGDGEKQPDDWGEDTYGWD